MVEIFDGRGACTENCTGDCYGRDTRPVIDYFADYSLVMSGLEIGSVTIKAPVSNDWPCGFSFRLPSLPVPQPLTLLKNKLKLATLQYDAKYVHSTYALQTAITQNLSIAKDLDDIDKQNMLGPTSMNQVDRPQEQKYGSKWTIADLGSHELFYNFNKRSLKFHGIASTINTNAHVAAQRQDASDASVPFFCPSSPLPERTDRPLPESLLR
ncbi:hypothetical protein HYFRA_00004779 [Hymenoscyphus fraxineus]|uniref:Uncharacterized protein n=1 Tax=Hymenoscyphus fraxineus TaxID=746836 RepID=A0A9N9KND7_9HELO|nr:hypothetical protein HYFRA_00004779 [Hymenoscyphus fraxineus]